MSQWLGRVVRWRTVIVEPEHVLGREVMLERRLLPARGVLVELTILVSSAVPESRRASLAEQKRAALVRVLVGNDNDTAEGAPLLAVRLVRSREPQLRLAKR